jgi:hypothetical protein
MDTASMAMGLLRLSVSGLPSALDGRVEPPTVATSRWAGLLPANAYTIRAAILTCSKGVGAELKIYRKDRRILLADRYKSGWSMVIATDGQRRDKMALRSEKSLPGQRVKMNWLRAAIVPSKGCFNDREAEMIFMDFVSWTNYSANIARWIDLDWE